METVRLVVVGTGRLATRRIYPYIGAAGARLVGACALHIEHAERVVRLFGGRPYGDMEKMIETERPDGVIICIGPEAHAQLAPVVMRYGIPVYTEKPPAVSAAAALEVARVSKESGVLCTTAFKKRYNLAYNRAKEFMSEFASEDFYSLTADYAIGALANDSPRTSLLLDFAIHLIDLSGYLFGDTEELFAYSKGPNAYVVAMRYCNGALGSFSFSDGRSSAVPTEKVEITIKGGNVMSIDNSSSWRIARDGKCVEWREPPTFLALGDSGYETGHLAEIMDFVEAIKDKRSTRSAIYESYKSMVVYEAILESSRSGRPVRPVYEAL